MFNLYLVRDVLHITELPERTFRSQHKQYELVQTVRTRSGIDAALAWCRKVYRINDVIWSIKYANLKRIKFVDRTFDVQNRIRNKVRLARLGKRWSEYVRARISLSRKNVGNFRGKHHRIDSRVAISNKMKGNTNSKGLIWIHDPYSGKCKRVRDHQSIPVGWMKGRPNAFQRN